MLSVLTTLDVSATAPYHYDVISFILAVAASYSSLHCTDVKASALTSVSAAWMAV